MEIKLLEDIKEEADKVEDYGPGENPILNMDRVYKKYLE